jgi:hypothetical protein
MLTDNASPGLSIPGIIPRDRWATLLFSAPAETEKKEKKKNR